MGCLSRCFGVAFGDCSEPRGRRTQAPAQLVSSSVVSTSNPKVCDRRKAPSRNALSTVFLREDEGPPAEGHATTSGTNRGAEGKRVDRELNHEGTFLKNSGALLETQNEIRKGSESTNSVNQSATHPAWLPALSDESHFMEVLKAEDCQTPSESHHISSLPDALSSSWKGCDALGQHDSEAVSKNMGTEDVNNESVIDCGIKSTTPVSSSFICEDDTYLFGSKSSPFSTPSKVNDEMQNRATTHAPNLEELKNEDNARACVQHCEVLKPVQDFENCGLFSEDSCQPNGSLVSVELSISDECSLFQNSEGSVSSSNKIRDIMNTPPSVEKCLTTEATIHGRRSKVIPNSAVELPSLSQWLKPPNPKKAIVDEAFRSDRSHSAKGSEEDRPIIGMVAAHWTNNEPHSSSPKWWDGNGIPNSTNKYKEDQKVSWHATPFEERLEKALSDEKLLSQRKCSTGNSSQFSGVEGEESDTAVSKRLFVAAK